jgi:hypothetical protein
MTAEFLEDLLRAIDPVVGETGAAEDRCEDQIWQSIANSLGPTKPPNTARKWGAGVLAVFVVVAAILLTTLVGHPTSAVAASLNAAAVADAPAAAFSPLAAGQYYYQESQVSLVCQFRSPNQSLGSAPLTYTSDGTIQTWTKAVGSGDGKVLITPSAIGTGGSHFATATDENRWIALGRPFIPCALANASNQLGENPANTEIQGTRGGSSTSVSGNSDFGFSLAADSESAILSATTRINQLPTNMTETLTLLARGQININGSVSSTPQMCPVVAASSSSSSGCTPSEQLGMVEQLIALPDASAKLGSVLYEVLATMPDAKLAGLVATPSGAVGTAVQVQQGTGEVFEVVLAATTGTLLSCSELQTQNGASTPIATINYGPVQTVAGLGVTPVQASNP